MIVTVDLETYYSRDYSLTKMSEMEYIMDARFQVIGAAIKVGDAPAVWYAGFDAVQRALAQIDWSRAALLSHNTRFDGAILAWRFDVMPKLYLDTLSMARAMTHAVAKRSSLASVAKYLGLGEKGDEVMRAIGMRLEDFQTWQLENYGRYCVNDTELCRQIFNRLAPRMPKEELRVIDLNCRMYIEPQLQLVPDVLEMHLAAVRAEKARVLATVGEVDKVVFASNLQFAELLTQKGVDVPMKPSPANPEKMIPALARGDRGFQELLADATQPLEVQALLAARMQTKSTIEETRTEKLLTFSRVDWSPISGNWLPVPLRYYGAHTGRFSGDGGFNMQNIRRDSAIRKAIVAPPGYAIVTRDASQIEARMVAWMAGQNDLLADFANGIDIYSKFASTVFGCTITKADKVERFVGKTCILGLGYSMGADRFRHTLFIGQGNTRVDLDAGEAERIVKLYRRVYSQIVALWTDVQGVLSNMTYASHLLTHASHLLTYNLDPAESKLRFARMGFDALWLPNGMAIAYPGLRFEQSRLATGETRDQMIYDGPYGPVGMFGGKAVENIAQALARIVITSIMRRVWDERRLHPAMQVHDSLTYVVPQDEAPEFDRYLEQQFAIRPEWAGTLPLASEGGYGATLAEAEGK